MGLLTIIVFGIGAVVIVFAVSLLYDGIRILINVVMCTDIVPDMHVSPLDVRVTFPLIIIIGSTCLFLADRNLHPAIMGISILIESVVWMTIVNMLIESPAPYNTQEI